jgi:hypothetical protein
MSNENLSAHLAKRINFFLLSEVPTAFSFNKFCLSQAHEEYHSPRMKNLAVFWHITYVYASIFKLFIILCHREFNLTYVIATETTSCELLTVLALQNIIIGSGNLKQFPGAPHA